MTRTNNFRENTWLEEIRTKIAFYAGCGFDAKCIAAWIGVSVGVVEYNMKIMGLK